MTGYLLDTNHASQAMADGSPMRMRLSSAVDAEFNLPIPAVGELWFMVYNSARIKENSQRLERLLPLFIILPFDMHAARQFGLIRSELRRSGRPIPQIDVQIAAICRVHDLVLLSADSHYDHVAGLRVENWLVA